MEQVKITYHGHACFSLEHQGYTVVLDPYQDGMIPGLPNLQLKAHAVYCSHQHGDHNYTAAVELLPQQREAPYSCEEILTDHDAVGGILMGKNTVRIFRFGGLSVAHLGDLGRRLKDTELDALRGVDCLLIPVGGFFTIDSNTAKEVAGAVAPRVCIPMHYRTDNAGLKVISHINDFTRHFPEVNRCDNTFVLTEDTPRQILVLNFKP